jgi:hemerythrin superfamily protein
MRATDLLREDHERVHQLFLDLAESPRGKARLTRLEQIAEELEVHAQVEEEIFYPAIADVSARVEDARSSHEHLRRLLHAVQALERGGKESLSAIRTLRSAVLSHVAEEEGAMFLEAGRLGPERLERLGREIQERKKRLKASLPERGARNGRPPVRKIA